MSELTDFDEMYQEIVLDHYRNPRNKSKLSRDFLETKSYNPFCGDEIELQLSINDGKLEDISVTGRGCAISQSSGSLMSEVVINKSINEIKEISLIIRSLLKNEEVQEKDLDRLGDAFALEGVKKFPVRIKCALLSWAALKDLIDQY
ncbi:MAG: SUF system NifU family Fe-S cluster assembly protein [Dehalococcoidia bacterium]|nr:SUF system NifU family Fe-S cluster assembly protein [Dehalococcoidia bacterium]